VTSGLLQREMLNTALLPKATHLRGVPVVLVSRPGSEGMVIRVHRKGSKEDLEDVALLRRVAANRDIDALKTLVDRYKAMIASVCANHCMQDDEEDAWSVAVASIFKGAATFKGDSAVSSWMFTITRNAAIKVGKQQTRADRLRVVAADRSIDVEPGRNQVMDGKLLDALLDALPEEDRLLLEWHYLQGMTLQQIATRLNLSYDGVKSRQQAVMRRLRSEARRNGWTL
jgi:RNA polymerase sigma-70 factor, ECF subfamily